MSPRHRVVAVKAWEWGCKMCGVFDALWTFKYLAFWSLSIQNWTLELPKFPGNLKFPGYFSNEKVPGLFRVYKFTQLYRDYNKPLFFESLLTNLFLPEPLWSCSSLFRVKAACPKGYSTAMAEAPWGRGCRVVFSHDWTLVSSKSEATSDRFCAFGKLIVERRVSNWDIVLLKWDSVTPDYMGFWSNCQLVPLQTSTFVMKLGHQEWTRPHTAEDVISPISLAVVSKNAMHKLPCPNKCSNSNLESLKGYVFYWIVLSGWLKWFCMTYRLLTHGGQCSMDFSAVPRIWLWQKLEHNFTKNLRGNMSKHVCQYAIEIYIYRNTPHLMQKTCPDFWRLQLYQVEEDTVPEVQHCSLQNCPHPTLKICAMKLYIPENWWKLIAGFFLKTSTCIFRFSRNGAETYYLYTTYTCLQEHMYGKYYWYYSFHLLFFSVDRMYIDAPGYNLSFFIYGLSLMYPLFAIVLLAFSLFWDIPIVAYMSTWNSESRNIWMKDER